MENCTHSIDIDAKASQIFELIEDVTRWPAIFPPTIHAEQLSSSSTGEIVTEQIRIWATANNTAKTWTSTRTIDAASFTLRFQQDESPHPVEKMLGEWRVTRLTDSRTRVILLHSFSAVDDDADHAEWIRRAVDRNSRSELEALKRYAELDTDGYGVFTFEDTEEISGSLDEVFSFVNDADLWPQRLPHVASVDFAVDESGIQALRMETSAPDGSSHVTESFRVSCQPNRICYKQTVLPALLRTHVGEWTFTTRDDRVLATSRHTVQIDESAVAAVLGVDSDARDARAYVQNALSRNSSRTLQLAKAHVER